MQNAILLYCSFLFIESLTLPRLPFYFLSDWPPNPNPKKGKYVKGFLISNFLVPLYFVLEILLRLAALFFPNNMEGSKRTTTRFGHLHSSTKKSKKTKKTQKNKKNHTTLWWKVFCQAIHQIALSSLWLQPEVKTCCLYHRNGTIIHTFRKTKYCRQHVLATYTKWALKVGSLLVLRVQRLE